MNKKVKAIPNASASPIFIHSLWRSGSTYLFSAFRRSETKYYCYQEPFHEQVLINKEAPEKMLNYDIELMQALRHPPMNAPYYHELYLASEFWKNKISKPLVYDQYFDTQCSDELAAYIVALLEGAKARPVIQECRTSCRIGAIKGRFQGLHIHLWRNPWDQWWSYKSNSYFDLTTQLIINAANHPEVISRLRHEISFTEIHSEDIAIEFAYFDDRRLSAGDSYFSYYVLWLMAMFEANKSADIEINIDSLSESDEYKRHVLSAFSKAGIVGLNFSDSKIFFNVFSDEDRHFFLALESRAHNLFLSCGYEKEELDAILEKRVMHESANGSLKPNGMEFTTLFESNARAHEIVVRQETEFSSRLSSLVQEVLHEHDKSEWLQSERGASKSAVASLECALSEQRSIFNAQRLEFEQEHLSQRLLLESKLVTAKDQLLETEAQWSQRLATLQNQAIGEASKSKDEYISLQRDLIEREQSCVEKLFVLSEQHSQLLSEAATNHIRREQEIVEQLIVAKENAERVKKDIINSHADDLHLLRLKHDEREHALMQQVLVGQQELVDFEQARVLQEKKLSEQIDYFRQELENSLRDRLHREQEIAIQLLNLQQQSIQEKAELAKAHHEHERQYTNQKEALSIQLQAKEHELQALQMGRVKREQEVGVQLLNVQQQLKKDQAEMANVYDQKLALQRQELSRLKQSLATIHGSFSWRITAPLRKLLPLKEPNTSLDSGFSVRSLAVDGNERYAFLGPIDSDSESPPINIQHINIETIMPETDTTIPKVASSLDELLVLHDQHFVFCAYRTILGREPDPQGLKYYLGRLRLGFPKIQILAQLRLSKEGKARMVNLSGMDSAINRYKRGQYPILGWLLKLLTGVEGNSSKERQQRIIENQLFEIRHESNRHYSKIIARFGRLDQLESALGSLSQLEAAIHSLSQVMANQHESLNVNRNSVQSTAINSLNNNVVDNIISNIYDSIKSNYVIQFNSNE